MNFKTTIALLILFVGIGAYLLFTRAQEGSANKGATATEAAKLLDLKMEDVTKVAVLPADGKPLVLEKTGLNWRIIEPIQALAETNEVESLLRDVTDLQSHSELDRSQEKSAGLDKPPYKIELTTKDKTVKLDVGDKPALGDDLPVLIEGKDKPQIVSASLITRLQKPVSAYRKTRLLDVTNEAIKQLQITRGNQTIRLARTGATGWQITEPKAMPADTSMVDSMLFAITGLNSTGFDDSISPADAGLSKPRIVVSFSLQAPSTQPSSQPTTRPGELSQATTITFGGYEDVTRKDVYATVSGGPVGEASAATAGIAKVSASTLDSFRKTALDLRDKTVLDIDPDRVESFSAEIDHPATTQPTTVPASHRAYAIARRKEDHVLGPVLPASTPTTRLSATTNPISGPATLPALATTKPAAPPIPMSKWTFTEGNTGDAEETQVDPLLTALHPLKAEKFLNPAPTTAPPTSHAPSTYTLTLHVGPGTGTPPADYTLHITDAGAPQKPVAELGDLRFELDRALLKDLDGDFKTKVAAPQPPPSFPGAGRLPPGHPSFLPPGGPQ